MPSIRHTMSVLALVAACDTRVGARDRDEPDAAPTDDAVTTTDGGDHTDDALLCFGPVCLQAPPTAAIDNLAGPLDTTSAAACDATVAAFCVIAGTHVTVPPGAILTVTGSRPLVVIATEQLAIHGTLDAASHLAPRSAGPGALAGTCTPAATNPTRHGGGAGGSFGALGGAGAGNNGSDTGGTPGPALVTSELRAGCRGQNATVAGELGVGGDGGGGVYLFAGARITIAGVVNASGAAGSGGKHDNDHANGGGGGGSGGMIVLDAPAIDVSGRVFADGGGGGEGASHSHDGVPGTDPDGNTVALGGNGEAQHGGNGGAGTHAATAATAGQAGSGGDPGGGGGGGGGPGIILVRGATTTGAGAISPAATPSTL